MANSVHRVRGDEADDLRYGRRIALRRGRSTGKGEVSVRRGRVSDDFKIHYRAIARADEKFFALCDQQLIRMGDFFKMKLADAEVC